MRRSHHSHWFHRLWSRFILWKVRHPWPTLLVCGLVIAVLVWQSGKLSKRLRGGLISLPGSESDQVLRVVERDFSEAIAYPTILVQEGLGTVDQLERSWQRALKAVGSVPEVREVIDMHLGRKIVSHVKVNTRSFSEAQEMINAMRKEGLPEGVDVTSLGVSSAGAIMAVVETDVRSFKEGENRRKTIEESVSRLHLPEGSSVDIKVTRHPQRNFAMIEAGVHSYPEAESLTASIQQNLHDLNLPVGNRVVVTGLPALFYDLNRQAVTTLKKAECIGLPLCFLLLIWVFGAPVAALLPVVVALVVLTTGSAVMSKVGKHMEISMYVPSVLSMIGLGVGVDYMLILVSRFRECALRHPHVDEAIVEAMHLTAPTLLGSGVTVAIGFSALLFTPVMMFRAMGIAGIVVILSALTCIFVLAPPLFKITGRFIVQSKPVAARPPFWKRWTHFVVEHPAICLLIGLALMAALAWPALQIEAASLNPDSLPRELESKRGYNLCKNGFGAGWLMPAVILIKRPDGLDEKDYLQREQAFIQKLRAMNSTLDAVGASDLSAAQNLGFGIEIPSNFFISKSGRHNLILATFDGNPMSLEGRHWVERVREIGHAEWKLEDGFFCRVGGVVAATLDIDKAVVVYLWRTGAFCLISTFVCLALLYRSVLIPLQAIAMNLLSVFAAYGFLVLWFQKGIGRLLMPSELGVAQGMNSVVILLLFCALFGLSMDYQVFLISRIAEEWRRSHNNKVAVRHGIELMGRVVTGAAGVMISIFLSFAFVSVLETRQFGIGMAAATTFDATIVRLLVFPSAMLLVGSANWWWPFGRIGRRITT
ncbi:MAG: MMPL family transporter [Verrucomicrobia bacterium]|nr:MMPL family transporter [Verrucomicrobiota bacterium]